MSSKKKKSESKPSMVVDIYKRYQRRKKFNEARAWEDEYFYIYDLESDERVMENLQMAGRVAFFAMAAVPVVAVGISACLVKYFFF